MYNYIPDKMLRNTDSTSSRVFLGKVWINVYSSSQVFICVRVRVRACVRVCVRVRVRAFPFFCLFCFCSCVFFCCCVFCLFLTSFSTRSEHNYRSFVSKYTDSKCIMRSYASLSTQCQYLDHTALAALRLASQIPPSSSKSVGQLSCL